MQPPLTKQAMIRQLADNYRLAYADVWRVIDGMIQMTVDALAEGRRVEIRGFGVFDPVQRKARTARNPRRNYTVRIPPRKVVRFRQGKLLDERVTLTSMQGKIERSAEPTTDEPPRVPGEGPA